MRSRATVRPFILLAFFMLSAGSAHAQEWVNMGCAGSSTYNATCNPTQEQVDIQCSDGEMLQGRELYGGPSCEPPNNEYRSQRRCVVDAACTPTPAQPDVTAMNQAPSAGSSYTTGTSVSFTASVSNIGAGAAASFPNMFQFCTTGCTSYNQTVNVQTHALSPGGSGSLSASHTFPSANTYYYRACADFNASFGSVLAESNEGNNCSNWTQITVSAPAQPDLTAGTISPATATSGVAVTLSSTVSNSGTGTTGAGFYTLFQRATSAAGANTADIGTHNRTTALANSSSFSATLSYTFPSAATWYVRACSDKNSSAGTGTVTESNEANNCSGWTAVTVSVPAQPDLVAGSISPTSAAINTATTFSGTVTNSGTATAGASNTRIQIRNAGGTYIYDASQAAPSIVAGSSNTKSASYTFTTSGTYTARVCADWNSAVAESNEANNCGSWTTVTVSSAPETSGDWVNMGCAGFNNYNATCNPTQEYLDIQCSDGEMLQGRELYGGPACEPPNNPFRSQRRCVVDPSCPIPQADLTATNWTPAWGSSHNAGTVSFTAGISNAGTGEAASFPNVFQIQNISSGTSVFAAGQTLALAAGASGSISASYSLAYGSYQYRACADNNSSWAGTVSESNEGNNCSAWTQITVNPPGITASCSASPASVGTSQNVTWTASASGGTGSYTYSWSGTDGLSGSGASVQKAYSSSGTKTGSVTVTSGGVSSTVTCSNSVTVIGPPVVSLTANPASVLSGGTSVLTWSSSGATSCTNTGGEGAGGFTTGGATSGSDTTASISGTTTYGVSCTGAGGTSTAQATITQRVPVLSISASPERVQMGGTSTITWSSTDAITCSVTGPGLSSSALSGSAPVTVTAQQTYVLSCEGFTASAVVNVIPKFEEF